MLDDFARRKNVAYGKLKSKRPRKEANGERPRKSIRVHLKIKIYKVIKIFK
jgi:hypothetical protein